MALKDNLRERYHNVETHAHTHAMWLELAGHICFFSFMYSSLGISGALPVLPTGKGFVSLILHYQEEKGLNVTWPQYKSGK